MSIWRVKVAELPLRLRDLGDDLVDLDNGSLDQALLYLAAEYIEHLESILAKARRAIGDCT